MNDKVPKPGPLVYYMTRDSDVDGALEDAVDVWTVQPERFALSEDGAFWLPDSAYWMSGEFDLTTRAARWSLATAWRRVGTTPDDDRQVIRFERLEPISGSAQPKAEVPVPAGAKVIELVWANGPAWHAVEGHVPNKEALKALSLSGVDRSVLEGPNYQWAVKVKPDDDQFEYALRLAVEPIKNAFPVTVYHVRGAAK